MPPHISAWVICDTGSTDNTKELIETFFKEKNIPGMFANCKFENFSQARNIALECARHSPFAHDYILLADADMELKVIDPNWTEQIQGESFDMYQQTGIIKYQNRRLAKAGTVNGYVGVTHEFLNLPTGGCLPMEYAFFADHCDGANRPDKFRRDIKLLKAGLEKEPKNERYMYYLAQSYRDAGKPDKALKWYERRVKAGGWDEEVWAAQQGAAYACKDMGDEAGFIRNQLLAYKFRPHRKEPLYDLAKHFREKDGFQHVSLLFSEPALDAKHTGDALFVNDYAYAAGIKDEFSICAFYDPEKREKGFSIINELSLRPGPYQWSNEMARRNLFFYHQSLAENCPSFSWRRIGFDADDGWIAMNPSVTMHDGVLKCAIRTVNYKIDEHGRYLIRGTDGTANSENPINTRTWLATMTPDLEVATATEISNHHIMPKIFNMVVGFEDMRLFTHMGKLYASATWREGTPEGWCEQVIGELVHDTEQFTYIYQDIQRMLGHEPKTHEKNWTPFPDANPQFPCFLYRMNELVDNTGKPIWKNTENKFDIGAMSGSSQVIPYNRGFLCIVHEARQWPDKPVRYYTHRFVELDENGHMSRVSRPFYLREKGIEYVAGISYHPTELNKLIISFGFKDAEACIGHVSLADVERFLCLK